MRSLLAFLLLLLCLSVHGQYEDALLAIVGEKVITLYEVQKATKYEEYKLAKQFSGAELEKRVVELRRRTLDDLIDRELVYMEFEALKAKVPQDYLQKRMNQLIQSRANGNVVRFEEALQAEGMTIGQFREKLAKDIAVELIVHEKISRGNIVADQDVTAYYEAEKAKLAKSGSYHLAVIQLRKDGKYAGNIQKTTAEILDKAKEGKSFEELAKLYSEGANADNGGDQGWMDSPNEKLRAAVENLQPGQISGSLVELGGSYYMVKLVDVKRGGVPELTDELRSTLAEELRRKEENRLYKAFIQELYVKYPVRRLDGKQAD